MNKGAPRKLHAVSREGTAYVRETSVRGRCATSRVPRQGDIGCNVTCMDEYEIHRFNINQSESHVKSDLDTLSLNIDSRDTRKLKFLIDTGAEISIIRSSSLNPGVSYQLHEGVDIKGISNTVMRTEGTVDLKILMETHETMHTGHSTSNEPMKKPNHL